MAQLPRKSSPGRKSAPPDPAEDLFAAADQPAPETAHEATFDDSTPDEWLIDESAPVPLPAKPIALPTAVSLPTPASLARPGSHLPGNRPEAAPTALPAKPAAAEPIPEALPVTRKPARHDPAPTSTRPPAEAYDPFEIDEELPAVPVPAAAAVEPSALPLPGELQVESPLEETESAASPLPVDETGAPPSRHPAGRFVAFGILTALLALFIGVLYTNRPDSDNNVSRPEPRVPLSGQIATLSSVDSGWRSRQPGDLVSTVDVTLPVPSRQPSALLPQVQFTLDASASKTGFLRFIFLDPDRKISGDVRVVKVSGGTIDPLGSGAVVAPQGTATVYGSLGFMDRPGFVAYATGSTTRWSVEISESTDYNAKEEDWTKLDTFDLRNASAP